MIVKIVADEWMVAQFGMPKYETPGSAGMDLRSRIDAVIAPGDTLIIPTGIKMALPNGYEAQVRSRSGLAAKRSVFVLNSPGTIDSDYRDEIGVILHNASQQTFVVSPGDRIAQLVVAPVARVAWSRVESLDTTERRGGFGSTETQ